MQSKSWVRPNSRIFPENRCDLVSECNHVYTSADQNTIKGAYRLYMITWTTIHLACSTRSQRAKRRTIYQIFLRSSSHNLIVIHFVSVLIINNIYHVAGKYWKVLYIANFYKTGNNILCHGSYHKKNLPNAYVVSLWCLNSQIYSFRLCHILHIPLPKYRVSSLEVSLI